MADPITCDHCEAVFAIQRGPRDAPENTSPSCCPFCGLDELREFHLDVQKELPGEPNREQHEPPDAALTLATLLGSTMTPEVSNEPERPKEALGRKPRRTADGYDLDGRLYFNKQQLLERGWTKSLIAKLLDEQEIRVLNPSGGRMIIYAIERVEAAEKCETFKDSVAKRTRK